MYSHKRKRAVRALAVAVMLSGATGTAAVAMGQPAVAQTQHDHDGDHRPHHLPGEHIEGRIAFLRAELKITGAQEPQFDKLAAAMRQNAHAMRQLVEQARAQHGSDKNSLDGLDARLKFSEARVSALQSFRAAYAPLYQSLSDQQKKTADDLLAHRHHHHRA